ncbi:acyltransferase family protein [Aeromicrobium sp. UC242_57]|uniref:acyltransferase family protein n=1 Tax=Aeromicrobium sp. UC242_57 TaxID=3374624 RepID=UPI003793296D
MLQNVFFFLAGLHLRPQVERLAAQANTRRLLAAALVYAAAVLTMTALRAEAWWGVWPAVSAAAVVLGVTAAAMTARGTPRTAARLSAIGRRTLPIYVMHLPLLACFDELVRGRGVEPTGAWFAVVGPVLLTAALVATCLVLERVVILARAGFLLDLPAPWRSAARARS